ncbi:MAG TPA: Tim44-like domain-containing protein [Caldimonas sp.]|nr:Tim44-like domain-containing protein [Caldimonas sp.]HEX2540031.1 Tim44-like domain-containing protein [Caldimonas sp.]
MLIGRLGLPPRLWRRAASIGVGLPLLLGSSPAAAAGVGTALIGGISTWIGVLAAVWAVFGLHQGDAGAAAFATGVALVLASLLWSRRQRVRDSSLETPLQPLAAPVVARAKAALALPVGVDGDAVLGEARARFLRLQAAWDAGDVTALSHLTTPEMLEELLDVLTARGSEPNRTHVLTLHAELLGLEEFGAAYVASVEFSGLIRESADAGAVPFRELWMLAGTKDASPSWRLARQQALF